ncbi:MAG TPA: PmoA family protein [Chitinophagaceae bacterium]
MKKTIFIIFQIALIPTMLLAQQQKGFSFVEQKEKKQVDILFNNKLLTAYCYYDSSRKPMLFPVNAVDGITVTRSYPFQVIPGERTDHPHHTGIWLNYESVNGLDFWNNSTAIALEKRSQYGTIIHQQVTNKQSNGNTAELSATAKWVRPDMKTLLNEQTTFHFKVAGNDLIIDRITTLTATDTTVVFRDVKDGMFAIRVARELELPSKEKSNFVDDKGNITAVPASGADVSGMYYSSEGLKGDSVWATKGKWVMLTGKKDGKDITIGIVDHPSNVGYPAYWHARGYGLFAVNPLGRKIFSNGKEELNFSLPPGKSVTFRYRVIIHSGKELTKSEMDKQAIEFANTK